MNETDLCVSVIITVYNGEKWVDDCMSSIDQQTASFPFEVVIYNDASTDRTRHALDKWHENFCKSNVSLKIIEGQSLSPLGVGYGRNVAVMESSGKFLCFHDIDDIMLPERVQLQWDAAKNYPNALIGSKFTRLPENSTARFTRWANNLTEKEIQCQVYTSHGPTLIMPTWFCSREVFNRVEGFSEKGQGTPEDLIFFYKHLDLGGSLFRVDKELLIYRYHAGATTFSIDERTIWDVRLERLQRSVLHEWPSFTIWNAGKVGKRFYRSLNPEYQKRVTAFCDVDVRKIATSYVSYDPSIKDDTKTGRPIPIISFREAEPPLIICVKLDMTGGVFEDYLDSLNLEEGKDFVLFT